MAQNQNDQQDQKAVDENTVIEEYSEASFWTKVKDFAAVAGKNVIEKALWLFYAAQKPETPLWAKTVAYSALGYFISPLDAIPDVTPIMGFSDDLAVLIAALAAIAMFIDDEVKELALDRLVQWFGEGVRL